MRHLGIGATFWFSREAFLLKFPGSENPFADGLSTTRRVPRC